MAATMVPDPEARPSVFPTDRLLDSGKCRPELRADLRRIADGRNACTVAGLWAWVAAMVAVAVRVDDPWSTWRPSW